MTRRDGLSCPKLDEPSLIEPNLIEPSLTEIGSHTTIFRSSSAAGNPRTPQRTSYKIRDSRASGSKEKQGARRNERSFRYWHAMLAFEFQSRAASDSVVVIPPIDACPNIAPNSIGSGSPEPTLSNEVTRSHDRRFKDNVRGRAITDVWGGTLRGSTLADAGRSPLNQGEPLSRESACQRRVRTGCRVNQTMIFTTAAE